MYVSFNTFYTFFFIKDESVTFKFPYDISIIARVVSGRMDVTVKVPKAIKSTYLQGLLGNFDDSADNDMEGTDGKVYNENQSYQFGESCKYIWLKGKLPCTHFDTIHG